MDTLDRLRDLTDKLSDHSQEAETVNSMFIYIADTTDGYFDWYIGSEDEYLSDNFKLQLGYEPHEMPNKVSSWMNIIYQEDLDLLQTELAKHFETNGKYPFSVICRYEHKDNYMVKILCRGKVIEWDAEGNPIRFVGMHIKL